MSMKSRFLDTPVCEMCTELLQQTAPKKEKEKILPSKQPAFILTQGILLDAISNAIFASASQMESLMQKDLPICN